jgi:hypothetical protein
VRRVLRRTRYVVSRQYLSLASAAVIAALLYVALTNDVQPTSKPQTSAAEQEAVQSAGQSASQAPLLSVFPAQRPRSIIYYIVESDEHQEMVEAALLSLTRGRFNTTPVFVDDIYVVVRAADAVEEAQARELLEKEGAAARARGFTFQVLDLRLAGN